MSCPETSETQTVLLNGKIFKMEFKVISPCGCSALIPPPFIKPISEPVTKRKASAQKSPILVSVFLIKRFPFSSCVISLTSEVPIQVCPKISLSCRILEM